jgi:putative alpha-1,2-mannosidase
MLTLCRFYCIWDSFRAQHPLLTIIDPVAQTQMVRALIDIYRHVGMCTISLRAQRDRMYEGG